jgi:hypothetical protein
MVHIQGANHREVLRFPERLDDYIAKDNLVRFLGAFVDELALEACGFRRAVPAVTGRPGYAPGDLLKLSLYMEQRVRRRPEVMKRRQELVEHLFGTMKRGRAHGYFPMRGLEKVRAEFSVTALADNLRRVLNLVEMPLLIATLAWDGPVRSWVMWVASTQGERLGRHSSREGERLLETGLDLRRRVLTQSAAAPDA